MTTADLPLQHEPKVPELRVLTPWGSVRIDVHSRTIVYLHFDDVRVGRCWLVGSLRFRHGPVWKGFAEGYIDMWAVSGMENTRNRGQNPLVTHRRMTLTPGQRLLIETKLVPWMLKWIKRNRILFELYDEWEACAEAWEELQKDDPNGRH